MGGHRAVAGGVKRLEAHAVGDAGGNHVEDAGRNDELFRGERGPMLGLAIGGSFLDWSSGAERLTHARYEAAGFKDGAHFIAQRLRRPDGAVLG